ncbi:MAG TPA: TetR/AcrR family transcriptional regulator [Pseudonocardia sp.]|jgi:AcrR family transcriptional regulator
MTEASVVIPAQRRAPNSGTADQGSSPKDIIFAEATRLFGAYGYNGTSIRDIAKAVGILPGSLYTHISNKGALLLEIIESGVDRFNAAVDRLDQTDLAPDIKIRDAIREHLMIVAENPQRTLVVFHQWRFLSEPERDRLRDKRARYAEFYIRTLRAGIDSGIFTPELDCKVATFTILGTLNWTPEWLSPDGPDTPAHLADQISEHLLRGLLTRH